MRELVLGGEGLIGSGLCEALRARGHSVVSLDLLTGCDLRHVEEAPFQECDRVWFLAWDTGGAKYIESTDYQHETYKHNSELSLRVFEMLARTRKPFVFATSQLSGQRNAYGLTKLLSEHWAAHLGGQLARFWNVYGWEQPSRKSHVVTDLVLSGLTRGRVVCMTTGVERRKLLYKSDCVAALLALVDSGQPEAEIAGDRWLTIGEVAAEIATQLGVERVLGEATGSEVPIDPQRTLPSWRPQVTLPQGIERVIADARAHLAREQGVSSAPAPGAP
jgi:nucleoside-diphosphate-sugar epimerase